MPHLIRIGVTGSYGKTSAKHMLGTILARRYRTLITPKSYNTPMGVVRTINEQLRPKHRMFVCEMGARQVGDIREICDIVKPTYGILTSVGIAHLEAFRTTVLLKKSLKVPFVHLCNGKFARIQRYMAPVLGATLTFGFREFWVNGRDFMLNGSVIRLRALHNTNSNSNASAAAKEGALNTIERMRRYGFNFLITGNYNFRAGDMSYIDGLLDGCQESGMLMSFSLPHVSHFNWKLHEPDVAKRYTDMTRWLIRRVQNNPAVVMYAMNHNATGYHGDQNPLKLDGVYQPEPKDLD